MKTLSTLFLSAVVCLNIAAQNVCDTTGNVIIYSNYDGGVINIYIDQNIPNIKIGICTYEPVTVNIGGPFVGNVTEVRYAGYVSTNNNHCSNSPSTTTITGVTCPTSVNFLPASTLSNPFGYSSIVCNYSCSDTTSQGGCNTPDQLVHYFITTMGGTLRYHYTQYGCWAAFDYGMSAGGNCCVNPFPLGFDETNLFSETQTTFNADNNEIRITGVLYNPEVVSIDVVNVVGQVITTVNVGKTSALNETISTAGFVSGIYFVRLTAGGQTRSEKITILK